MTATYFPFSANELGEIFCFEKEGQLEKLSEFSKQKRLPDSLDDKGKIGSSHGF